jgi:hypothetical protein
MLLNEKQSFESIGLQAFEFVNQHYNIQTIVGDTVSFIEKAMSLQEKYHKN